VKDVERNKINQSIMTEALTMHKVPGIESSGKVLAMGFSVAEPMHSWYFDFASCRVSCLPYIKDNPRTTC
jgi:hypothetical protein